MHELALSRSIVELVTESAARENMRKVTRIVVEIGAGAAVEPSSLSFCFDIAARQTVAEGAVLVIDEVPLRAKCLHCGCRFSPGALYDACPDCGSHERDWLGGQELRVKSFDAE